MWQIMCWFSLVVLILPAMFLKMFISSVDLHTEAGRVEDGYIMQAETFNFCECKKKKIILY